MLSIDSFLQKRRVELPILALCTAMMFALPAIRNTNPGIPPIGTLFDIYSFFFAQFLISFVAASLIVFYIVKASSATSAAGPVGALAGGFAVGGALAAGTTMDGKGNTDGSSESFSSPEDKAGRDAAGMSNSSSVAAAQSYNDALTAVQVDTGMVDVSSMVMN
jgi:hypothetical protein